MNRSERMGLPAIALIVFLCMLWGIQQVAIKLAIIGGFPPVLMAAVRSVGAAICLGTWIVWRRGLIELVAVLVPRILKPGLVIGLLFGVEFLCLFPGLARTTAARGVLFFFTAPFFTALFAHMFLPNERLGLRQMLGLAIAFGGVAITFADGLGQGGGSVVGDVLCTIAGALWGATTVFIKANRDLRDQTPERILFYQVAGSGVLLSAATLALGEEWKPLTITNIAWASLFLQTVVVTFASYLVWFGMLVRYKAAALSGFTFLVPLMGIAAGTLLLGEPATPALLAGLAAVAVGMWVLR